jgi:hypothetical protein
MQEHTLVAHARFSVLLGARVSYCAAAHASSHALHAPPDRKKPSEHEAHLEALCAGHAEPSAWVPLAHAHTLVEHSRLSVDVAALVSCSTAVHSRSALQVRSLVCVGAADWYCVAKSHSEYSLQTRSLVAVGGSASKWNSALQFSSAVHV